MDELTPTLPGDIPGLLRVGSVVRALPPHARIYSWPDPDDRLVVLFVFRDESGGDFATIADADGEVWRSVPLDRLAIDLSDATARAHAAWYAGGGGPSAPMTALPVVLPDPEHAMFAPGDCFARLSGEWSVLSVVVSRLDASDPRLLPDGSRWVDAEALRRVVLHLAGRTL